MLAHVLCLLLQKKNMCKRKDKSCPKVRAKMRKSRAKKKQQKGQQPTTREVYRTIPRSSKLPVVDFYGRVKSPQVTLSPDNITNKGIKSGARLWPSVSNSITFKGIKAYDLQRKALKEKLATKVHTTPYHLPWTAK